MKTLLAALVVLAAADAGARSVPITRLDIDAVGTAQATPDQLEATLAAQQSGSDPAAVQNKVNIAVAAALHAVAAVSGVEPRLLGYDMNQDQAQGTAGRQERWIASSRISLSSADGVHLLDLVGRLQSTGLILDGLAWQLSPSLRDRAQADATRAALQALVRRAGDAASALGLHVDHLAEIRVSDQSEFAPRPLTVMRSLVAAPPSAPAAAQSVGVTASATVLLRP